MDSILRCATFSFVLLSLLAAPGAAAAAAPAGGAEPAVDEAYRTGIEMRRRGDDRGALAAFQKSYRANPVPRTLAQIGLAEQALGRWVDAEAHLTEAMKATSNPWIVKNHASLEPALTTIGGHLGSIAVEGPRGAAVDVNGAPAGTLPLDHALRVPAGTVVLSVRAPGYVPMQRIATVAAEQLAREQIDLVSLSQAPPGAAEPPPSARTSGGTPAALVDPALPGTGEAGQPPPGQPGLWHRRAAWTAAGLGAVALITGATFHFIHEDKLSSYNRKDASNADVCNRDAAGHFFGPADCADDYNGAASAKTGLIVGYTAAVVFGGVSAALFLTAPSERAASTTASRSRLPSPERVLGCGPGPGQLGIVCGGLF
ncbi:MAG TPA: PEGA domain-containing protein [Polyangia bacterium]|nr:PEGA domain-containing protein [Polyangia bacterium]